MGSEKNGGEIIITTDMDMTMVKVATSAVQLIVRGSQVPMLTRGCRRRTLDQRGANEDREVDEIGMDEDIRHELGASQQDVAFANISSMNQIVRLLLRRAVHCEGPVGNCRRKS